MRNTYATFDLPAWRRRMGWNQDRAAHELGVELSTYRRAEYLSADHPGHPVKLAVVRLAQLLEAHPPKSMWNPPPVVDDIGQQAIPSRPSKLTEAKVRAIRKAPKSMTNVELAAKYGVSPVAVRAARIGETWKDVT
jgi:DNA-binding XRE family transcriptional regulator